jgi:hypothetical protein
MIPEGGRSEAPAVVPHPPTPGVGGGLGGARSSLAMPNTPDDPHETELAVGVAHKISGSLYIIALGQTLRSKCPGAA